jgi:hypothetical protein
VTQASSSTSKLGTERRKRYWIAMTNLSQHAVQSLFNPAPSLQNFSHRVCLLKFKTSHPDSYNLATGNHSNLNQPICYRQSIRLTLSSALTKIVFQSFSWHQTSSHLTRCPTAWQACQRWRHSRVTWRPKNFRSHVTIHIASLQPTIIVPLTHNPRLPRDRV